MSRADTSNTPSASETVPVAYSATARMFHWLTVGAIVFQVTTAVVMTAGMERSVATSTPVDATTDALYSVHKLVGFLVLWMVVARLAYRLSHGAPPDAPILSRFQRIASHTVHWVLYGLLLMVPLGGWIAVSMYDARDAFGIVSLPQIAPVNAALATSMFNIHRVGGFAIVAFAGLHIAATVLHVIRGEDILGRMLPGAAAKKQRK